MVSKLVVHWVSVDETAEEEGIIEYAEENKDSPVRASLRNRRFGREKR